MVSVKVFFNGQLVKKKIKKKIENNNKLVFLIRKHPLLLSAIEDDTNVRRIRND